ncbi:MAG TPA: MotA/TolQ/ExbB proton channel family protein [Tepidisphaeraceae bacterium]|nr:MotA/TolQ/ExbB proton channel family protein [Tepidisphaeraceae bacterium]
MQWACDHFYWLILLLAAGHLLLFARLWRARRLQAIWLADHLENLLQGLSSRSDRDPYLTVDERIDSFLANVREVLDDPSRAADRRILHDQIVMKDETKKYLRGSRFETLYSVARTSIEMYPLLGIMGTVLAIGLALNAPSTGDAAFASERIVRNFAGSIWATLAGIGCGIVLLLVNSVVEPGFQRLLEHRWEVREVISAAKTQLGVLEDDKVTR